VNAPDSQERLDAIRAALANPDAFGETKKKFSEAEPIPLPTDPVPAAKLRDYVGADSVEKILTMREGEIGEVQTGSSVEFFHLVSRRDIAPRYEDVAEEVAARFARTHDEETLRAYLSDLRSSADIDIDTGALQ
jgi:hypothetical protein